MSIEQLWPKAREVMKILQRPFPVEDIEWRISRCGFTNDRPWAMVLAYFTARAGHTRMDEAFGIGGWKNEFHEFILPGGIAGVVCRLWYRDPETEEWVWKENGAPQTDFEAFKGGLSDAEKRAMAELGIGRYLYRLTEDFATTSLEKTETIDTYAKTKDGQVFYWSPPSLPAWALPEGESPEEGPQKAATSPPVGPETGPLRDVREQEQDEESPFGDEVFKAYPNLIFPSSGPKRISVLRACAGHAQLLGYTEEQFTGWHKGIVKGKELKDINAAQAVLLLQRIKKIHREE